MQNQHLFNRRSTVRTERFVENGGFNRRNTVRTERFVENGGLLLKGIRFCI